MPMHTDPDTAPRGVLFAIDAAGNPLPDPYASAAGDSWTWLHLAQKNPEAQRYIVKDSGIPTPEARALIAEQTRPRCTQTDKGVLFIGRGVNLDPTSAPEDMKSIRAWIEPDRIVTVVVRRMRSTEAVADSFSVGSPPQSPADVLAQVFSQMVDRMSPIVQDLSDRLDEIQVSVIDDEIPIADISELSPVRMRAVTLHRYLLPLSEAASTLASASQLTGSSAVLGELLTTRDQLARIIEDLAAIESRASVTRDEMVSRRSDQLNQRVYTLTVLAAVFLPLTVFTGLMGMNVGGIPLANTPIGFLITSLIMLLIMGLTLGLLRLIHWI